MARNIDAYKNRDVFRHRSNSLGAMLPKADFAFDPYGPLTKEQKAEVDAYYDSLAEAIIVNDEVSRDKAERTGMSTRR